MFQKDDYVMKVGTGLCRIEDIVSLKVRGENRKKQYYYLCPIGERKCEIYVPVDTAERTLRHLVRPEEARELLSRVDGLGEIAAGTDREREAACKVGIKSNDPLCLMRVAKTMYSRKRARGKAGKRSPVSEEQLLQAAENAIFAELSFVLGLPREQISSDFHSRC